MKLSVASSVSVHHKTVTVFMPIQTHYRMCAFAENHKSLGSSTKKRSSEEIVNVYKKPRRIIIKTEAQKKK